MHKSVYAHIDTKEFYMLYNVIGLYFTTDYDITKYGLKNRQIANNFKDDKLKRVYDALSLKIPDARRAIFLIISNFLVNGNNDISDFSLESEYYNTLIRYNSNKYSIIDDFSNICKHVNICDKIKSGDLADDVVIKKNDLILFSYINKVVPIVNLSIEYLKPSNNILEMMYGGLPSCSNIDEYKKNIFDKVSFLIYLSEDDRLFLKTKINMLLNDK